MARSDRLFQILTTLRDGHLHRAEDLARRHAVSVRTIYRDMDTLVASGVPVQGARGVGYRIGDTTTLPPLTLTPQELEALNLGIAIVSEVADPDLKSAALSLADKVDATQPERSVTETEMWKFATYPFADAVRGFSQMSTLRAAIRARQKLRLTYHSKGDRITTRTIRPLHMEYWGRVWTLTAWCEKQQGFRGFRVDLIQSAEALPEMFVDEPGKRLSDYNANL
ncbi:MAG: WYL domain-containing protein [Tateyamaria sp.]|uniref:helix-turn-helix transcriptional regulator n=1 Tax=Tateyamaria sp. TaxID=1929288 RepID=UPI00329BEED1